jgi:hypothetical protein
MKRVAELVVVAELDEFLLVAPFRATQELRSRTLVNAWRAVRRGALACHEILGDAAACRRLAITDDLPGRILAVLESGPAAHVLIRHARPARPGVQIALGWVRARFDGDKASAVVGATLEHGIVAAILFGLARRAENRSRLLGGRRLDREVA